MATSLTIIGVKMTPEQQARYRAMGQLKAMADPELASILRAAAEAALAARDLASK